MFVKSLMSPSKIRRDGETSDGRSLEVRFSRFAKTFAAG
jgi:hypothetical protein